MSADDLTAIRNRLERVGPVRKDRTTRPAGWAYLTERSGAIWKGPTERKVPDQKAEEPREGGGFDQSSLGVYSFSDTRDADFFSSREFWGCATVAGNLARASPVQAAGLTIEALQNRETSGVSPAFAIGSARQREGFKWIATMREIAQRWAR